MVYEGEQQGAEVVARKLIGHGGQEALRGALPRGRHARPAQRRRGRPRPLRPDPRLVRGRQRGHALGRDAVRRLRGRARAACPASRELARRAGRQAASSSRSGRELVLDGLHQNVKLARHDLDSHGELQGDAEVPAPQAAAARTAARHRRDQLSAADYAPPLLPSRSRPAARRSWRGSTSRGCSTSCCSPRRATPRRRWTGCATCRSRATSTPSVDLEAFFAALEERTHARARRRGRPRALRRAASARSARAPSSRSSPASPRAAPGYHAIRASGEGVETLPETRPYEFGDDLHAHRLGALARQRPASAPRASSSWPRRISRSSRPSTRPPAPRWWRSTSATR